MSPKQVIRRLAFVAACALALSASPTVFSSPKRHFLYVARPAPHGLQLTAAVARIPVQPGSNRARDHLTPPTSTAPRLSRVSASQSVTASLKASARSSIGAWPQHGRKTRRDSGRRA